MSNAERKQIERDVYNRQANMDRPAYHTFWDMDLYRSMHAFAYDPKVEEFGARYLKGRKVLVLGAGRNEVRYALRYSDEVHALNISERTVAELQELFPEVHSFVGDAEQLDQGERYDVVLCKSILHHLHPIEEVLKGVRGILKPGGHLVVVAEPGLLNPFAAAARKFSPSQEHTPGEQPFVFSKFRTLLSRDYMVEEEHHYFIIAMLWPYMAAKIPRLRAVAGMFLKPTLKLEAVASKLPGVSDLCWVVAGVYRAR